MSSAPVRVKMHDQDATKPAAALPSLTVRVSSLALLLALLTFGLYQRANHFSFINYDDNHYVYENSHIRAGLSLNTIRWAFTSFDQANWHPLTWISHAVDSQVFGMNPAGHHFTSIALQVINVILLFLLLYRVTRRAGASFFVAALFAVHPLNVESVVWIAERKNLLSTTFFLLSLGAYGHYAQKPGWKRYLTVVAMMVCGLASKPMLVTTPFVLLLLDFWPLGRVRHWSQPQESFPLEQQPLNKLVLEKLPLLLPVAASSIVTLIAQRASGAVGTSPFPFSMRLANAVVSYGQYLSKCLWPSKLALFYPYSHSLPAWQIAAAGIALATISALVFLGRARGYLVVGWLWFLGTLVPVIGIVQVGNQAMADRYVYVPLIGIFLMVAWTAVDWAQERRSMQVLLVVPGLLALAALSAVSYRQIGFWDNSLDVWAHALQVTQRNYVAEENEGVALVQLNRIDEAYPFFVRAAQAQPNDPVARLNIGTYLYQHGHRAEAIEQFEMTIHLGAEPGLLATTYANLGSVYNDSGDYEKARLNFDRSLQLKPDQAWVWQATAALLQKQGKTDDAIRYFGRFLELQPSGQGYLQLAKALAATNHRDEAIAAYNKAVTLDPSLLQVQASPSN